MALVAVVMCLLPGRTPPLPFRLLLVSCSDLEVIAHDVLVHHVPGRDLAGDAALLHDVDSPGEGGGELDVLLHEDDGEPARPADRPDLDLYLLDYARLYPLGGLVEKQDR